jgi:caffeoyl-CoA O-methyltransferase
MSRTPFYLSEELASYVTEHSEPDGPVVAELVDETAQLSAAGMQVDTGQARLLGMLVAAMGATRVLEVGTFTGLSSLRMAAALPEDGELVACDVSEEWTAIARRYWERAWVADRITLRLGPAAGTLQALADEGAGPFDLAFVDADKEGYHGYVDAIHPLLRTNGLVVVDNTLWSGRVTDAREGADESTRALQDFNDAMVADDRFETVLVPAYDGLTVLRRR